MKTFFFLSYDIYKMSQVVFVQNNQLNLKNDNEVKSDLQTKLVILYESPLTSDELQCLYSVINSKMILEVNSKHKSSSYKELLVDYNCLLIDVRLADIKKWCLEQSNYLYQTENIHSVYKKKRGKHIEEEDLILLKKSFGVNNVKKYLPVYSKTFDDYLLKLKNDHVKHDIVSLNVFEKIYYLAVSCFARQF
jgi:hypothetical protein